MSRTDTSHGIYLSPHSAEIWHKAGLKWGAQARTHGSGLQNYTVTTTNVTLALIFHRPSIFGTMREALQQDRNPWWQTSHLFVVFHPIERSNVV